MRNQAKNDALAIRLRAARLASRHVTSDEAYAQLDQSLKGMTSSRSNGDASTRGAATSPSQERPAS